MSCIELYYLIGRLNKDIKKKKKKKKTMLLLSCYLRVIFVEHWLTMHTQIRHRIIRCIIRIYTVFLHYIILKIPPNIPKIRNRLFLLIKVGKSELTYVCHRERLLYLDPPWVEPFSLVSCLGRSQGAPLVQAPLWL